DIESLRKNLCSISEQVDRVVIIDNSNDLVCQNRLQVMISENENITLIQLNENKGIAYAQNIGFVYSLKAHADFVITFDQDSSVENGLVQSLYEEYLKVKDENDIKIACIGPSV
ncbi:TPA: glycosyltransferase, partial [Escherichia coli]|nr:glycosyltransferase [Escherichia coli]